VPAALQVPVGRVERWAPEDNQVAWQAKLVATGAWGGPIPAGSAVRPERPVARRVGVAVPEVVAVAEGARAVARAAREPVMRAPGARLATPGDRRGSVGKPGAPLGLPVEGRRESVASAELAAKLDRRLAERAELQAAQEVGEASSACASF
jgi:hypothetical protein